MSDAVEKTQTETPVESEVISEASTKLEEISKVSSSTELKDLLVKVRQEEKQKVYNRIENLESQIKNKDMQILELGKTITDLQSKLSGKDEEKKTELQTLTETVTTLQNKLDQMIEMQESERLEFKKKEHDLELERYKEKKIASAKGRIVPEMVRGNSETEIDASFVLAKQRYQEIISTAVAGKEEEIERSPTPPAVTPTRDSNSGQFSLDDIQRMSPAEYAQHRKELMRQAALTPR